MRIHTGLDNAQILLDVRHSAGVIGKVVQSMPFGCESTVGALGLGCVLPGSTRVLCLIHTVQAFYTRNFLLSNLHFMGFSLPFPGISEFLAAKLILQLCKWIENVLHSDDFELFHLLSRSLRNNNGWW